MSITRSEELLEYEQAKAIEIWETPLSLETRSFLNEMSKKVRGATGGEDMGVGNYAAHNDGSLLPPLPPSLEKFKSWLGVAATINRKAYQTARLDPMTTSFDDVAWSGYDDKFRGAPFWESCTVKSRKAQITELSLQPLIDAIANLVEAYVEDEKFQDIVISVKKIAELAVKNRDQTQKDTYEQSGLITILASKLYLCNTRTQVSFTYREGKGYQQLAQTLIIQTCVATLDFGKCERSAAKILQWDQTDVDEWETQTASYSKSPNTSPAWDH